MPPEMLTDKPYCPFKTDIWQLGSTFLTIFQQLQNFPEILDVLDSMAADDPDARPTARAAFQSLLDARRSISAHIMMEPLPRPVAPLGLLAKGLPLRSGRRSIQFLAKIIDSRSEYIPPNDRPRAPDGFSYTCEENLSQFYGFVPRRTVQLPARTSDDRDVLIVVLNDGEEGKQSLDILRHVSMAPLARVDRNHALPVLQILQSGDYTFGAFPLVGPEFDRPWFPSMVEAMNAVCQVMEGVAFLHDHLIAYRDLFHDNILHSGPDRGQWPQDDASLPRYYIIDFETAIRFHPESDAATRTVTGVPFTNVEAYRREAPPEMRSGKPYCPFKADIWQLGSTFLCSFKRLDHISEILAVFFSMVANDPDSRPTAHAALRSLMELCRSIPTQIMTAPISDPEG
ncbi:hypothetical protein OF83DRAFT_1172513 [Amylostereum chailletii]|nr:hypothetical protein OF83DRAFT_1172513 [Amylostereum chailletii]